MRLSIILPTIGRTTLQRNIRALRAQMGLRDELFVVADGPNVNARIFVANEFDTRMRYLETWPTEDWGCSQIDFAMPLLSGDMMLLVSDDDFIPETALQTIRDGIGTRPSGLVHVFQARFFKSPHILGWSKKEGEVSGQQIVAPVELAKRVKYSACKHNYRISDWYWLTGLLNCNNQTEPVYHSGIISEIEAHNEGRMI